MTATSTGSRLSGTRPRAEAMRLLETAARDGITRQLQRPWPVFLINGTPHPDARLQITALISDGLLHIVDDTADSSPVEPTALGLAKIGATS
jgi:hypothetical protein